MIFAHKCQIFFLFLFIIETHLFFHLFTETFANRTQEKLPGPHDVQGAAHGLARLQSLYSLNSEKMIEEGIIESKIKNGIQAVSKPSVMKLSGEI